LGRAIVLGIDTATWTAAVGITRDDRVLAEHVDRESRSHSASLPLLVDEVLARAGLVFDNVGGIAVSIGPGSFTGLRVGLALAKGLAFAGGIPIVGVPTLEALACMANASAGETVCAALDARKREVYAALFAVTPAGLERVTPDLALAPAALAARLPPSCVVVGDATDVYPELRVPGVTIRAFADHPPRGGVIAQLGFRRLAAGDVDDAGALEPVYVRAPDAALPRSR